MHPRGALAGHAGRKARLRERIAGRRTALMTAAAQAAPPLLWIDRIYLAWQGLPEIAKVGLPAGASFVASFFLRRKWRRFRRWMPAIATALRWGRAWAKPDRA